MEINANSKQIIKLLVTKGYKAYAVGGCVRDAILKREISDVDITTSATPEEVEKVLDDNAIKYYETGLKHGTITAVLNGESFEITTFRHDGEYSDNRHPNEVRFVKILKEDLARRDFTMNALAYNDAEGIVDEFGGIRDIKDRVIRAVGNPVTRFHEDALRIMRALRFSAVLGFDIENDTKQAVFNCKELLKNIAYERLFTELTKLIMGDFAENVLLEYRDVLAEIIPELKPCFDFPQNSKWHIYDVYTHTVKSVCIAPKKEYVRLALLFHDIGKPFCKTTDENGDHFYGHPEISAKYTKKILTRFKVSNEIKTNVIKLVEIHDITVSSKRANLKKWMRVIGDGLIFDYFDVKIADFMTHNPELAEAEIDEIRFLRNMAQDILDNGEPYRVSDLVINGDDLLKVGFSGAQIKAELEKLIADVSAEPEHNDRQWLLNRAQSDFDSLILS